MPANNGNNSAREARAEALLRETPDTLVLQSLDALALLEPSSAAPAGQAARPSLSVEALHRATFVQLPLGIGYANRDGTFIWCNRAFDQMLGLASGEHQNKTIRELTYSADLEGSDQLLQDLWQGRRESYSLEKRYVRRNGEVLWVRVTAALVRDAAGAAMCTVGFLEDISSQRQTELALQQSRRMFEAVAKSVPVALIASDLTGAVIFSNPAAQGLDAHAARAEYRQPDGVTPMPAAARPLALALAGASPSNLEFVLVQEDRKQRTFLANACPLSDMQGGQIGAVAAFQDITHLRQTEAEVERIHKDLMVASRQAGMAEVATNVLHNVGNVLNSINVSVSLVAERLRRSKTERLGDVAKLIDSHRSDLATFLTSDARGAQLPAYLTGLAEHVRAERNALLSEVESLRMNLDHIKDAITMQQDYAKRCGVTEKVAVTDLVEDSLRMNAGALTRHHVILRRDFRPAPEITTDRHKVLQILVNLIRNAKYACDESGVADKQVTVRVDGENGTVRIAVIDNGVGISPETMGRLFSHGFTTRKSGHGFGLHSAALAASELGGRLSAHSDGLGKGASFTLELPLLPPGASA
jgi:PAS domain S-box-containing protein